MVDALQLGSVRGEAEEEAIMEVVQTTVDLHSSALNWNVPPLWAHTQLAALHAIYNELQASEVSTQDTSLSLTASSYSNATTDSVSLSASCLTISQSTASAPLAPAATTALHKDVISGLHMSSPLALFTARVLLATEDNIPGSASLSDMTLVVQPALFANSPMDSDFMLPASDSASLPSSQDDACNITHDFYI
ncbi:hypothetical protein NM688_g3322 [Phlebia brevispora]|uniref:Uncharacterized protein n=1 Tax=Phlebia brevispora TaxID=194682 RepID=A0ACC1T6A3_9APHY|nr:hypothetical protein NM688_g3322 [Phlebia brevispora]